MTEGVAMLLRNRGRPVMGGSKISLTPLAYPGKVRKGDTMEQEMAMAAGVGGFMMIVWLALVVLMIASMWCIFSKAGQPGWAAIIPIYNVYVMLLVAGKPGWWLILMLIPVVNIVVGILTLVGMAEKFGKGVGFVVGLILLPIVFYPILGFGSSTYQG